MKIRNKIPILVSLGLLGLAVMLKVMHVPLVEQLQLKTFDAFQHFAPRPYDPQTPVRIIDIDDESLKRFGQWPWPRSVMADLVTKLHEAGAAAIAMDIVFAEPDRTSPKQIAPLWQKLGVPVAEIRRLPDHDELFARAIEGTGTVTGFVMSDLSASKPMAKASFSYAGEDPKAYILHFKGAVISLPQLEAAAAGNGAFNADHDLDGIIRRVPLMFTDGEAMYPSLSLEALRVAQGAGGYIAKTVGGSGEQSGGFGQGIVAVKAGNFEIPTDAKGHVWIHETGYQQERYIPAWQVLEGSFDKSKIEGQILFVGTSAPGLKDIRATPLQEAANGVELHVQLVEQVLAGHFLMRPDFMFGLEIGLMVATGLGLMVVMGALPALWGALFMVAAQGAAVGSSLLLFTQKGLLSDPVFPSIVILLLYFTESLRRYITTERERRNVRDAFGHYMSPALVEQLAQNPDKLKLGGEIKEMSILFSDIRGFTALSEKLSAEELTRLINRFLTPLTRVILDHKGTIDKYMGDCIMAFWNAPLDDDEHASHAATAALGMLKAMDALNETLAKEAEAEGREAFHLSAGIGINTGRCCVGNMGSDMRFDYSVLGDDVNLASRLEGQSKTYGVDIVIGEKTFAQIKDEFATLALDQIRVKGKKEAVAIYTICGDKTLGESPAFTQLAELWAKLLSAYRAKEWDSALNYLQLCRSQISKLPALGLEGLFELYEERVKTYRASPPPADWDGVFEAKTK